MFGNRKSPLILKILVVFLSFAMVTAGFSAGANSARIIPSGKVSIIRDGKVVGEFSQEAPLPEGSLLRCEAQCTVRLDDVYMVVEPGTEFSVTSTTNHHDLYVQEGTVYYSQSESSRPLQFSTPAGDATTGELTMTESELKGYVRATETVTEIGVIGGGTMILETISGDMAVTPGNAITLAAAGSETSGAAADGTASEETGGLTRDQIIAIGVGSVTVLAAGGTALASSSGNSSGGGGGGDDGDDDGYGSPSSP